MANPHPKPPIGKRNAAKPDGTQRVKLDVRLAPEALAKLKRLAEAKEMSVGKYLDWLIMKEPEQDESQAIPDHLSSGVHPRHG